MLIYIAHKFENNPENVEIVKNMLHELNLSDVENTYVSPVTLFGDLYDLMSYDDGMKKCFTLLAKCDAIVFTGGIGGNHAFIRTCISDIKCLNIKINEKKNKKLDGKEGIISLPNSKVKILVIPTDEEKMIAIETEKLLK